MPHNIFISWAKTPSRQIAEAVHDWLPTVIQAADPFMSHKDIDAGARGLEEIATQLKDLRTGLICVTASNQDAPWLNFEAGALSKLLEDTYVIPLAFDLDKGQIKNPLGQFQAQQFTEEDMRHTVQTINKALGFPLKEGLLDRAFNRAWPDLTAQIEGIRAVTSQATMFEEPRRTAEDMLEELVLAAREQAGTMRRLAARPLRTSVLTAQMVVAEEAYRKVADLYGEQKMSLNRFAELSEQFDDEDWRIVESSPFLVWYLAQYHGISRPVNPESDLDDVPF